MKRRKRSYANVDFGLPEEQVKFFDELTPEQVEEVRLRFSAGLINCDWWVYAVKQNGSLVPRRVLRSPLRELTT